MLSMRFRGVAPLLQVVACAAALAGCADFGDGWFGHKSAPATEAAPVTASGPLVKPTANSSIPALVNDVPITDYDVEQRRRLDGLGKGGKPASRDEVINELIDETLESIEAQRQNVNVPDAQVDGAFANIAQHVKMTPAGLTKALGSQGIDSASLKKRLHAQMVWQILVQRRTVAKAQITNQAVKDAIVAKGDITPKSATEYELQQIIFVVPKGSPAGVVNQRRAEAVAYRQRFAGCDQSINQAKQLRDVVVKSIGRRMSTDLSGDAGDVIQKTKVGETTPPQQSDEGIILIAVCAEHDIQGAAQAREEVQNDFYIKQSADLGKDYLKELRDQAIIERRQ